MRGLLYEAATVLLTRSQVDSDLRAWGLKLRERLGFKRAAVAVARKLAVKSPGSNSPTTRRVPMSSMAAVGSLALPLKPTRAQRCPEAGTEAPAARMAVATGRKNCASSASSDGWTCATPRGIAWECCAGLSRRIGRGQLELHRILSES